MGKMIIRFLASLLAIGLGFAMDLFFVSPWMHTHHSYSIEEFTCYVVGLAVFWTLADVEQAIAALGKE
jgi:hypothetical protein